MCCTWLPRCRSLPHLDLSHQGQLPRLWRLCRSHDAGRAWDCFGLVWSGLVWWMSGGACQLMDADETQATGHRQRRWRGGWLLASGVCYGSHEQRLDPWAAEKYVSSASDVFCLGTVCHGLVPTSRCPFTRCWIRRGPAARSGVGRAERTGPK